jgi:LPS sulfotransferase NodH
VKAAGFKVNYSQIKKYSATISWVKQNDVKIIHLLRKNLLKRLVSHKIANARNLCHSTEAVEPIKIYIDPTVLKEDFRRRKKRFTRYRKRFIDVFNIPYLEVAYESLVTDYDKQIHQVLKFLDVDIRVSLTSKLVKVNPDSLEDIIENYSEVKQTLMNTEFENFLY